jgi:coiled-coil domain-containing protein 12
MDAMEMDGGGNLALKRIRFRNYVPRDESLLKMLESSLREKEKVMTPSELLKREIEAATEEEQNGEDDAIAPKKPNWDLKNQVADKLARLQRRTQRAIVDILREKMTMEGEEQHADPQ